MMPADLYVLRRNGVVMAVGPYADLLARARGTWDPWATWTILPYSTEVE